MSLYSFIFFPREIDMPHFKSLVNENGIYHFNDLDKYSFFDKDFLTKHLKLASSEMFGGVYIHRAGRLNFKGEFKNKYYYELSVNSTFNPKRAESIEKRLLNGKDIDSVSDLRCYINAKMVSNLLYHIIDHNLKEGEFVEIYSEWLDEEWKYVWGPPKKDVSIRLDELLSFECPEIFYENVKYTIYKCKYRLSKN